MMSELSQQPLHEDVAGTRRYEEKSSLAELARRFAELRRGKQRARAIPSALRVEAVALLSCGVSKAAIHRACGVSYAQLSRWQNEEAQRNAVRSGSVVPPGAVFEVVDEAAQHTVNAQDKGNGFELHFGDFVVTIRQSSCSLTGAR